MNDQPVRGVRGGTPLQQGRQSPAFTWRVERGARRNYARCGKRLSEANPSLYRNQSGGHGLILVLADGRHRVISRGSDLAPVLADSLVVRVVKQEKVVSDHIPASHLAAMLRSEVFLSHFRPVDQVTARPRFLADFSTARPGYNDGGPGNRILYLGPEAQAADSCETIQRFLGVMDFATEADRTNTVAAALTVLLRHHWPGGKPLVLVTATKSHSGKSTVTEFVRGSAAKADILYESADWPMQSQFQRQAALDADLGLVCFDNVRLDSAGGRGRFIRSAFVESFVTTPEIILASPGAGDPLRSPTTSSWRSTPMRAPSAPTCSTGLCRSTWRRRETSTTAPAPSATRSWSSCRRTSTASRPNSGAWWRGGRPPGTRWTSPCGTR